MLVNGSTYGVHYMLKLTKAEENDAFMVMMRSKGFEIIFIQELPHPKSTRNCQHILAVVANLIHIREGV